MSQVCDLLDMGCFATLENEMSLCILNGAKRKAKAKE